MEIDPKTVEITDLIPQRRPFVMIDRLMEFSEERCLTDFTVREDNPFVSEGILREGGIVENIAQSCAAYNGWPSWVNHEPVRPGAIGAVKDFTFHKLPCVGDYLVTELTIISSVFNIILLHGTVKCGTTLIAEGEMKLCML